MDDDLYTACSGAALVASTVCRRVTRTHIATTIRAALFDAILARYIEIAVLGGLAFLLRSSPAPFVLALLVLLGVLLLGYADAKAEGLRVADSGRAERHTLLIGLVLASVPLLGAIAHGSTALRAVGALLPVGVAANVAAIWRLRDIAARVAPKAGSGVRHSRVARFLAALGSGLRS